MTIAMHVDQVLARARMPVHRDHVKTERLVLTREIRICVSVQRDLKELIVVSFYLSIYLINLIVKRLSYKKNGLLKE